MRWYAIVRGLVLSVVLVVSSTALAETLVIYPLESQDILLGTAVADQVAEAFTEFDVIGPDVAPLLVPPIVVSGGFQNLTDFLITDPRAGAGLDTLAGAQLVRDVLGADGVLTGNVTSDGEELTATLFLADGESVRSFSVNAPEDDPGLLANKVVAVLANRLEVERPELDAEIDLSAPYGEFVRALALTGAGLLEQAIETLEADNLAEDDERAATLRDDLEAVQVGSEGSSPARLAATSLSLDPLDEDLSIRYFQELFEQTGLPAAKTWVASLYASDNRNELASEAFVVAAETYPFGEIAQTAHRVANNEDTELNSEAYPNNLGVLLATSVVANTSEQVAVEKAALLSLTRLAPRFVYPFERLSFIAFDEDDAFAAVQALAVATRLEPENDVYWTNLGWSYYLLGLLEQSEIASIRATELAGDQVIALYNLGLARVVQGRTQEAMEVYNEALALDPAVDDAAIEDLENALEIYPDEPEILYPLATLYEQEGRRDEAETTFEQYLEAGSEPFAGRAETRLEVLRAPLPPLEISSGVSLGLGQDRLRAAPYRPGDRVYPVFELFTPGAELPSQVTVTATLAPTSGGDPLVTQERALNVPPNAIGFVVEDIGVNLPGDLTAGEYTLTLSASASEERTAEAALDFSVSGEPRLLRQLVSRDITMTGLSANRPLYSVDDLERPDTILIGTLVDELRSSAEDADAALPIVETGRFEGFGGGELFRESTGEDVRDFVTFLLEQETSEATFSFVDAYAQWALEGAPTE